MNAGRTVLLGLFALTFAGASSLRAGEGQRVPNVDATRARYRQTGATCLNQVLVA